MSRKYKFRNSDGVYFVTYTVVNWIDLFTRNEYRQVILDSWKYCQYEKGLKIFAWVIMTNHVHMIIGSSRDRLENIMRDMKRHTSTQLRKLITNNSRESRRKWILQLMKQSGDRNSNNKDFQLWQQHNHPLELYNDRLMQQKLNYLHMNPVVAGFVEEPEHYLYSSARDYSGIKGFVEIEILI